MRALAAAAVLFSLMWEVCDAQLMKDTRGDVSPALPPWVDVVAESIGQSGALLTLELQTAAEIPHRAGDSCAFEFVLRPAARAVTGTDRRKLPSRQIIRFDLSRWDGSPWFSMNAYFYHEGSETPRETSRVFDWKLTQNKLWVRFSLEGSSWSSLEWATRVFYGKNYIDAAPDSGFASFEVRRDSLVGLSSAKGKRSAFVYPSSFEPVLRDNKLTLVADEAYRLERELSGIVPLCGDSVSYIFNPYYGGAAIIRIENVTDRISAERNYSGELSLQTIGLIGNESQLVVPEYRLERGGVNKGGPFALRAAQADKGVAADLKRSEP